MPHPQPIDPEATDRNAILLMLSYVEAECLRLGADAAARHAALAASLLPVLGEMARGKLH